MDSDKVMTNTADHSGHRARLRKRYREVGLIGFDDMELMELILTYSIPRRDVSDLARKILYEMGSVRRVLDSDPEELMARFSLTENTATHLKLISDLRKKQLSFLEYRREKLPSVRSACEYCHELISGFSYEVIVAMYLDGDNCILDLAKISQGRADGARLPIEKIVDTAAVLGAKRVLVTHNHPSNNALPSGDDVIATDMLARALSMRGVELVEHIIVSESCCSALLHHMSVDMTERDPSIPVWALDPEPEAEDEEL